MLNKTSNVTIYREAVAERIKKLMHDWTANTLALATELTEAQQTFPINEKRPGERPGFMKWAMRTTGFSDRQINGLLKIHIKFGRRRDAPRLSQHVMKILSADTVPESARLEALGRAEKGERIGGKEAKKIARQHKLPTAKDANTQAKEEGRPVLARDGFIYFGTDPARAKEGQDRRKMVFGVRDALEHLSSIHLTGREFLNYAFPHQLTVFEDGLIKKSLRWLTDLDKAWDERK